jgi:hypothetical protein
MVLRWEHYTSQYAKGESINCCREGEFVGSCGLIIAMDTHKFSSLSLSFFLGQCSNSKPLIKPFCRLFVHFVLLLGSIHKLVKIQVKKTWH